MSVTEHDLRVTHPTTRPGNDSGSAPTLDGDSRRTTGDGLDGLALVHHRDVPDAAVRQRWLLRHHTAPTLLFAADTLVLGVYCAIAPAWARLLGGLWVATVLAYRAATLYRPRLHAALLDDVPSMARCSLAATAFVAIAVDRIRGTHELGTFALYAAIGFLAHVLLRGAAYAAVRRARSSGRVRHTTVVVGSGVISHTVVRTLDEHPEYGLHVVGYVDEAPARYPDRTRGWTYLGSTGDLPEVLRRHAADVLLIGYGHAPERTLTEIIRSRRLGFLGLFVVPRLFEIGAWPALRDHIGAVPVLRPRVVKLAGPSWLAKRAFDVVMSLLAIIALAPVLAAVALAVRIEGGPGVIFRQVRVGRDGREFEVLKFRSMRPADPNESNVQWSIAQDDRVGKVGRFIRRTSLDELPQLFNILRGDMTIVGPRPERPHFVEQFGTDLPHYRYRHRAPVGLTGLAQVSGLRGDTSIDDRARFDNYYIENWSFWLDVKVIIRTMRHVVRGSGS